MTRTLLLLLYLWPSLLWGAVGKLDSFEGDVKISAGGGFKTVSAGLEVEEGDLVRTSAYDKVNEGETFIRNEKGQQVTVKRGRFAFFACIAGFDRTVREGRPHTRAGDNGNQPAGVVSRSAAAVRAGLSHG